MPGTAEILLLAGLLILPLITALTVIPFWVLFKRVGRSPWLSLIGLIPVVGALVLPLILAFTRWPLFDRRRQL